MSAITVIEQANGNKVSVTTVGIADINIGGAANALALVFTPTATIASTNTQDAVEEVFADALSEVDIIDDMPSLSLLYNNAKT